MGYLDNSSITVDAILTKKGRQLLARGRDEFKITQFSLADDEIDYDLWNPDHPLGTAYYGVVIENMPVIEALPDETQMMKYKLVTLPKKTERIPIIGGVTTPPALTPGDSIPFKPQTKNFSNGNTTFGYTAILSDSDLGTIIATSTAPQQAGNATVPQYIGDDESAQTVTVQGIQFQFTAASLVTTKKGTITFIGNETGGRITIDLTVLAATLLNTPGTPLS